MWETAERSEEFSKPCENTRAGNPEQICKALNGFAQGGSFHSLFTLEVNMPLTSLEPKRQLELPLEIKVMLWLFNAVIAVIVLLLMEKLVASF